MGRCNDFLSPASLPPPETCCTTDQALLLLQKAANLDQCPSFHLLVISLDLSRAQAGEWNLWPWSTFFSFCFGILLVFLLVWGNVLGQILKGHLWLQASGNLWRESSGQLKKKCTPHSLCGFEIPSGSYSSNIQPLTAWGNELWRWDDSWKFELIFALIIFSFNDVSYQTLSLPKITPFFSFFWWTNIQCIYFWHTHLLACWHLF